VSLITRHSLRPPVEGYRKTRARFAWRECGVASSWRRLAGHDL